MATGACGIHCDVCKLNLIGTCTTCGPGRSSEAKSKRLAQINRFNSACPILECASLNQVDHCMRDCSLFPCENYKKGPCPFSSGFIEMQQRRLSQNPPAISPQEKTIGVPEDYWGTWIEKDITSLCNMTNPRLIFVMEKGF